VDKTQGGRNTLRFVYIVLLGMIIFNGVLISFAQFFPDQTIGLNESATDVDNEYAKYKGIDSIDQIVYDLIMDGFIFGIVGAITAILTRNPVFIGVGLFVGIFVSLWGNISQPIVSALSYSDIGGEIYQIFLLVFGIVILLSAVEIFSGQTGVEN